MRPAPSVSSNTYGVRSIAVPATNAGGWGLCARVAVEPISISRGKGLLGKRTWEFHKTPEMLFKSRPSRADTLERREFVKDVPEDDPLKKLKMRFVNGEITEEEYLRMKGILE